MKCTKNFCWIAVLSVGWWWASAAAAENEPPLCGNGVIGSGICSNPSHCCSQWGWCGTTPGHCDAATCWSGPACPRQGIPCGNGAIGTGLCQDPSHCCSQWGWCGTSAAHCDPSSCWSGPGCPRPEDDQQPCGGGVVGNGLCRDPLHCCSQFGFCDTSAAHCDRATCYSRPDNSCTRPDAVKREAPPTPVPTPLPTPPPTKPPTPLPTQAPTTPSPTTMPPSTFRPSPSPTRLRSSSSSSPTPAPSQSSSPSTSSRPTSTPVPTASPTEIPIEDLLATFKGITNAYSIKKGSIELSWDDAFLGKDDNVSYNVFVARGEYDFAEARANSTSMEDLIETFQNDNSTLRYYQYFDTNNVALYTPHDGEVHTLLVTAHVEGYFSNNTAPSRVSVSVSDPHIRNDVEVVGYFIPTSLVSIELDTVPEGVEHVLRFTGPVAPRALTLRAGDYVTGFTSDIKPFIRRIVDIPEQTATGIVMTVLSARLEEIFDELDFDGNFELSRRSNGAAQGSRRLFFDAIGGFFGDVGNAIGDAFTTVVEDVGDFLKETFGGEKLEEFTLTDITLEWEYEILAVEQGAASASLKATGEVDFEASLFARIRVAGVVPVFMHVGAKAAYSAGSALELSAGLGKEYSKTYDIWSGRRMSRLFFVGPVPIEVYAQPKLEFQVEAKASLTVASVFGVSVEGDTEVGVVYDAGNTPILYDSYKPPSFDIDYELPTVEGEASLEASAAIILSMDAGIYGGLLAANIGLSAGIDAGAAAGFQLIGALDSENVFIPTVNRFDIGFVFAIPFSASALYDAFDIFETTIYEKTWPIIALPSIELEVAKDHRCLLGDGGSVATMTLEASQDYPDNAWIGNGFTGSSEWYLTDALDGWTTGETTGSEIVLQKTGLQSFSPEPVGTVTVAMKPRIPPLPLNVVATVNLQSLYSDGVPCTEAGPCDGGPYFDKLSGEIGWMFNSEIFLSQPPDPNAAPVPSTVYKFEDFMEALKKLQDAGDNFQFWLGDDCSVESQKMAMVNMAAFLGQSMRETIIYDACDENSWDRWRADIEKEPTSPPEILSSLYPMSAGCGQLGQKYADYDCADACPIDLTMEMTATTNAGWIGAPPPLFCGPKSKYDGLGYWNPHLFCQGPGNSCENQPFSYPGQTAGIHVPINQDDRFPEYFYTHPLPDASGVAPQPRSPDSFPSTNVEGCCWWGRGVIQTTGRCNFGKLNKYLGAGAGVNALYPGIDFCRNPQSICEGPSDLKWIAGIFFWVSDPQKYDRLGFNYKEGVKQFVQMGCADDPDGPGCDFLFEYASGIVNRGCHDPGDNGCPGCIPGSTCDPAHHVPERVAASKQALRALMSTLTSQ